MTEEVPEDEQIVETARENPEAVDVEKVLALLDAENGVVRSTALRALAHVARHDPDLVVEHTDAFAESLDDGLSGAEVQAAALLRAIAGEYPERVAPATPQLVGKLGEQPPVKSHKAALVCSQLLAHDPEVFVPHADELVDVVQAPPEHGVPTEAELQAMPDDQEQAVRDRLASRPQQAQADVERTYGVRELAANALVEVARLEPGTVADRVEDLRPGMHEEPPIVRTATLDVVANVAEHDPDAVEPLIDDLIERAGDDTTVVRTHAIQALGFAGATEAVEPLREVAAADAPEVTDDLRDLAAETADFLAGEA